MARVALWTLKRTWGLLALALFLAAPAWADTSFNWGDATVDGVTGDYLPAVQNQGAVGTCWAFAAVGALESKFEIYDHNPNMNLALSVQNLVCPGTMGSISGGYPSLALDYFVTNGITTAAKLPYTGQNTSPLWPLTPPYDLYGVTSVATSLSANPTQVKLALEQDGPLVALINAEHDLIWTQPTPTSKLTAKGGFPLDHAVDIVGFQDDPNAAGGGYYIVENSWGTNVGVDGFFYVTYAAIEADGGVMGITGTPWIVDPQPPLGSTDSQQIGGTTVVPEPVSMIFFATGLVGVVGYVARRRMQTRSTGGTNAPA